MGRDTIQLENAVSTISQEYLLELTSEYGIPESLHPELPGPEDPIVEFPEGKVGVYTKFFEFANFRWMSFSKRSGKNTPQCYTKPLDSLKNWNNRFFWVDEKVFPTVVDWRTNAPKDEMPSADSYSAVSVATLKTRRSSGTPVAIEKSPLDLADEDPPPVITDRGDEAIAKVIPESGLGKEVAAMGPVVNKRRRKRGHEGAKANAPPNVLRNDHVAYRPSQSTLRGKSLAAMGIETDFTGFVPVTQETRMNAKSVSDPDLLSYAEPRPILEQDIAKSSRKMPVAEDPDSKKSTSFTSMVGSPGIPPRYFSELRHLPNDDFLSQYNIHLARQVAMGSQLRLKFEQEAKLLKKDVAQVARRDQRIEARKKTHKNLEALLEAEADVKGAAKAKNVELAKESKSLRIKAAFEEFKKYEDDRVNSRCVKMDARLDEELYPYMLMTITGCQWVIRHGLRLAVMKCAKSTELRHVFNGVMSAGIAKGMSEGLKHRVEHEKAKVDLATIEAYDPKADTKYVAALHALKDLKYPLVDQLEKLKDAPIDVIMASLFLECDSREVAP
nr:hypothetical protein [Tanacetum cinerariifolium]